MAGILKTLKIRLKVLVTILKILRMALKISKVLGRSPESWLAMQDNYDLYHARENIDLDDYEPMQFAL